MVAGLRAEFGPLPDQSMHEKTSVPSLINEIYTFLKQADARELQHLFLELDEAKEKGTNEEKIIEKIDNFETHVVPIIADICLLYTSPSPRDVEESRMPSSA